MRIIIQNNTFKHRFYIMLNIGTCSHAGIRRIFFFNIEIETIIFNKS